MQSDMKAPDKMYLNRPNPEEGGDFFPYWTENAGKADNVISEAYIRKEALLEWANKDLCPTAYLQLKNKLEEM